MNPTLQPPATPDDPAEALAWLVEDNTLIRDAELAKFRHTLDYVAMNLVDPDTADVAVYFEAFGDQDMLLAGPGAPGVSEFAVVEYAATLGMSTEAGKRYVGSCMEIRYRLPLLHALVVEGEVPVWRARQITDHTIPLPRDAAAWMDRQLAPFAGSCSWAQVERLAETALARFDPDAAAEKARAAAEHRHLDVRTDQAGVSGTVHVEGVLDLQDALDFDDAIGLVAKQLGQLGCEESLDVRRSMAAGELARRQLTLEFDIDTTAPRPRPLVVNVHLSDLAVSTSSTTGGTGGIADCDTTRAPITVDQIRQWAGNPDANVTIQPVVDLNEEITSTSRFVTGRLRVQTKLINRTCVFPGCTRPAENCDSDHVVAYDEGGPTATSNIGDLCRRHHRAKTHGGFTYQRLGPGTFLWTTPHGYRILRDHHGTHAPLPPTDP